MRAPLILAVLLAGCAARKDLTVQESVPPGLEPATVALLPAVLLAELPGAIPEGEDAFTAGVFVGNVVHSGGYIFDGDETGADAGLPVRSKSIELNAQDAYIRSVKAWTDARFSEALRETGLQVLPLGALPPDALPTPTRAPRRGSDPQDGTDNVNLPRFDLSAAPWPEAPRHAAGADVVLLPVVVLYYSHNGGWFVGQRMGCGSGARMRLFWAVYDGKTGAPLGWQDVEARHLDAYLMTPNKAQLEDHLIAVEERVGAELRGRVPL